jgi:hypothetical protein
MTPFTAVVAAIFIILAPAASLQHVLAAESPEPDDFVACLIAQYDAKKYTYTSTDGGRSTVLLMSQCDVSKYVADCVAVGGGSEIDCRKKAALLTQIFLKLKEAGRPRD